MRLFQSFFLYLQQIHFQFENTYLHLEENDEKLPKKPTN